jgi:hypothetical protein
MRRKEIKEMEMLGETLQEEGLKSAAKNQEYQAEPIERVSNPSHSGYRQDPYVVRATERAKIKIRNRIFQVNGGHAN